MPSRFGQSSLIAAGGSGGGCGGTQSPASRTDAVRVRPPRSLGQLPETVSEISPDVVPGRVSLNDDDERAPTEDPTGTEARFEAVIASASGSPPLSIVNETAYWPVWESHLELAPRLNDHAFATPGNANAATAAIRIFLMGPHSSLVCGAALVEQPEREEDQTRDLTLSCTPDSMYLSERRRY